MVNVRRRLCCLYSQTAYACKCLHASKNNELLWLINMHFSTIRTTCLTYNLIREITDCICWLMHNLYICYAFLWLHWVKYFSDWDCICESIIDCLDMLFLTLYTISTLVGNLVLLFLISTSYLWNSLLILMQLSFRQNTCSFFLHVQI